MSKHVITKNMKGMIMAVCLGISCTSLTLCSIPMAAFASEGETYSIETDAGKLSYVGSRMLDASIPYGSDEGKDFVLVIFEYENYTTDAKMPHQDFYPKAYQNGVELDQLSSSTQNDTEDYKLLDNFFKTSIKGGKLDFGMAFAVTDDSPLMIILSENGSKTVEPVSFEVNIGDEAPAGDEQAEPDSEQAETAGLSEPSDTEEKDEPAEAQAEMSVEEVEAQIAQQPIYVQSVVVANSWDDRFSGYDFTYKDCTYVIPRIINNSEDDIKDIQIWTYGWDENNLPVTVKYGKTDTKDIIFSEIGMVPGAVLNMDGADDLYVIPVDDNYRLAKAKCLVSGYRTYSGDTWTNPMSTDWIKCYNDKKLVEPVIYTDEETVMKVQEALNAAGYDCGTPDGKAGDKTHAAMNDYQSQNGLAVTNDITDSLLVSLGLAEGSDSETGEDTASEDTSEVSGEAGEIDALLQGTWKKDNSDTDTTVIFDNTVCKMSGNGSDLSATYTIDTDNSEVLVVFDTTDGQMAAHFPYSLDEGVLTLKDKSGTYSKVG